MTFLKNIDILPKNKLTSVSLETESIHMQKHRTPYSLTRRFAFFLSTGSLLHIFLAPCTTMAQRTKVN